METLKTSIFKFHYSKFGQERYSALPYYYKRITRAGREEEVSPALSQKFEKNAQVLVKCALIVAIYGFNFSFKMQFEKKTEIFLLRPFFLELYIKFLSKCTNSKKPPLPRQIPGYAAVL